MVHLHIDNFKRQIEPLAQIIAKLSPKSRPSALAKLDVVFEPMVRARVAEIVNA